MDQRPDSQIADAAKKPGRDCFLLSTGMILGCFALAFSLIGILSLVQKSPTVDEPIHLFAGYSYLKWGDFRANPEHPPLVKIWAALPLLAFDVQDPVLSSPLWDGILHSERPVPTRDLAAQMLFVDNDDETLFFVAKLQMIALGILLGIFVYLWSKELFGVVAGIAALFLFALDPNILAHSQIVHTDLAFTAFFFIGTYYFWRALSRLTWPNLLLACVFSALAAVTKYSYPAVLLVWAILGMIKILSSEPQRCAIGIPGVISSRWKKALVSAGIGASAALAAYLFTWAIYGFRFAAVPGGLSPLRMDFVMPPENSSLRPLASFILDHRLFPEAWIYGQLYAFKYLKKISFLLGQTSDEGFWSYFPVAFAVKTPLPTLMILIVGLNMFLRGRLNRMRAFFLLVPAVVYFSLAVASRANIGLRYILPIYPFLFVLAGGAVAELWRHTRLRKGVAFLAVWSLWTCLSIYPDYLAFFNGLVGGPDNGYKVLLDSNLDWGQDLKGLKRWMDAKGIKKVWLVYFGAAYPEYYGIDSATVEGSWIEYDPPATRSIPNSRYMALSAHLLYGVYKENSLIWLFRTRKPVAVIGHSIFVFNMDAAVKP
jgi:hypothetical protein